VKIVHVITGLGTGGAENMLANLVVGTDRSAFESLVVSLLPPGPLASRMAEAGVRVESLGMRRGVPGPRSLLRLTRLLRAERPDVVQTWLYHADLLGLLAAGLARVGPVAWNLRCSDMDFATTGRLTRWVVALNARLSGRPAVVLANSARAVDVHRDLGYRPRRFEVIPNGFDTARFRPDIEARAALRGELGIDPDAPVAGMIARYDPQKDFHTLLAALALVRREHPGLRVVLCGDGVEPGNRALAGDVRDHGLEDAVLLLGRRADPERVHAALDVAVLSSAFGEGMPSVMGEAMACGVPCAATDVGDTAAVIGGTGRVVPPRDPDALARAVSGLLSLPAGQRLDLSRAARARIEEQYSLPGIIARYEGLYRGLAAEFGRM